MELDISQTKTESQWNQVYNAFHRIFVVKTKQFVGSSVNVISVNVTQQTCGHHKPAATTGVGLQKANAGR